MQLMPTLLIKCTKINRSHTHTHRQRTTPPTPTHTHTTRTTPQTPKRTPFMNDSDYECPSQVRNHVERSFSPAAIMRSLFLSLFLPSLSLSLSLSLLVVFYYKMMKMPTRMITVKRTTGHTHTHTTAEQTTHTNTERATA